ncbi:MAG TPA: hypothetical protein PLT76_09520 [Candidatus Omnitrophota bacterium]|nr:hypothetical protein [Candidatus Omnitrophota bacterium]
MEWYSFKYRKKKWKPGFWVYVRFPSPDGRSVTVRLHVTPVSFKQWVLLEGLWRGSDEARSVSDTKFQKAMSCHMGLSGVRQNGVKKAQNRRFLRENGQFRGISGFLEGVLTDIH